MHKEKPPATIEHESEIFDWINYIRIIFFS